MEKTIVKADRGKRSLNWEDRAANTAPVLSPRPSPTLTTANICNIHWKVIRGILAAFPDGSRPRLPGWEGHSRLAEGGQRRGRCPGRDQGGQDGSQGSFPRQAPGGDARPAKPSAPGSFSTGRAPGGENIPGAGTALPRAPLMV